MGANNSTPSNNNINGQQSKNKDIDSPIVPVIRNINSESDVRGVRKPPMRRQESVPSASPMNTEMRKSNNPVDSATSAGPFKPQPKLTGGMIDSEINIQIEDIVGSTMYGGNFDTESSIEIFTEAIDNNIQMGGDADSNFDSNKLLDIIMQMGGDANSDSDEDDNHTESSTMSSNLNTSSYDPKKKKSKKDDDSSSSSSSSSDSLDDDSSSESNSDDSDSSSEKPISGKHIASHIKNSITNSDVYIMSESDSNDNRQISLLEFNDPLNVKKSKSKKSKKRY